ncbi:MAG: adenosylcobalamin phosphodiesterase [Chloroflexota bacterium]|nr:adenosylcobalamin phosphodiesterase [Chloroflexota bacterium]
MRKVPFRIGTTSYIIPADILPNLEYLAGQVDDVELVLFEVDDGQNNLPDEETLEHIKRVLQRSGMSVTVHLPLDLQLGGAPEVQQASIAKALQVMRHTACLQPWAYVLHLDGREVRGSYGSADWQTWCRRTRAGLQALIADLPQPHLLAAENLDGYPPEFWDEVLSGLPLGRCLDIGHLWKDGHDPLPYLKEHLHQARVLHLHGVGERDHQSLRHVPPGELRRVLDCLLEAEFSGVLTLEVFGEEDFFTSREVLLDGLHEMNWEAQWEDR